MDKVIENQIGNWNWVQGLSFDILNSLSDEQLDLTVGKNMGTLGEQFRHMIRVRFQYAEAIEDRKIGELKENIDKDISKSKTKLIEYWNKANEKLLNVLKEEKSDTMIDWKYWDMDEMSIEDHFNALMDHETLHNGEIVVYMRTHEIKFPESWSAWGL